MLKIFFHFIDFLIFYSYHVTIQVCRMSGGQQESKVKKDKTTSRWSYKSLFGRDSTKGVWGCMTSCRYAHDSCSSIDAIKQHSSGDDGPAPRLQMNLAARG